tara:strand:+ start:94 stop:1083 length:990 start_codon:yes stop_codon:yes gene_type:complete
MKKINIKDVLPLKMPISILIDPSNRCNFKCHFCPTGDKELLKEVGREEKIMNLELIQKILKDLENWKIRLGGIIPNQIGFYKDGEPLLNKHLGYFIKEVTEKKLAKHTYLTTNAALLNEEKALMLIQSGLNTVRISVEHVDNDGYKKITQTSTPYKRIVENVGRLFKLKKELNSSLHVHAKIVVTYLSNDQKDKFKKDFEPITDSLGMDQIMGWSDSEKNDFSLGQINHLEKKGSSKICVQPFSRMSICANGDITICCVDWSHQLKYANAKFTSLEEAWNSEELRNVRLNHLNSKFENDSVCKNCDYFKNQSIEDNIDAVKNELLEIYS